MLIHPTAIVEEGVRLGVDVEVGPYTVIHRGAEIGDGCRIGPHVVVYGTTSLGPRCHVHAGAVLGDLPQDLSFRDEISYVRIGEGCTIREGVTIHRGTKKDTETRIGPRCYLMANSHVGHNAVLGERVILANGALLAGYVEVGDYAFISGNCAVHQFCRVGRLAMLGGGAMLSKDCPPYCTVRANDLNRVTGLNIVGLRRAGFDAAARLQIKEAFRLFYLSGLNMRDAAALLREKFPTGPAAEFVRFVEISARGICAGPKKVVEKPGVEE